MQEWPLPCINLCIKGLDKGGGMSSQEELPKPSRLAIFRNRNFRLLWAGGAVSQFGDQFYMIALPWLVLVITGDNALALGSIMAAAAVPRAVFMMFGGALADRISPRVILIASAAARFLLVGLLAILVLTDLIELWMLFALGISFGFADAFAAPAASAILPRIVDDEHLAPGNALLQGTFQVSGIIGPAAAGLLIAFFGSDLSATSLDANLQGVGMAFLVDAFTFIIPVVTLYLLRLPGREPGESVDAGENIFATIASGLRFVIVRPAFRAMLILIALLNVLTAGPMAIGLPVLAKTEFPEGAVAFGILMSAFAAGSLVGAALGGALPRPKPAHFGTVIFLIASVSGLGIVGVSLSPTVAIAASFSFIGSIFNGYTSIMLITWFQSRTPAQFIGRVMSLIMTASLGLAPLSMAVAGALIVYDVRLVLGASAGLLSLGTLLALASRTIRMMDVVGTEPSSPTQP